MRATIGSFAAAAAVIGTATANANAQQAVQWRVEDGGNGHWYQAVASVQTWDDGVSWATSRGGYLASLTSDGENEFATTLLLETPNGRAYVGLSQLDGQTLPGDGWYWVTGESLSYTNWFCFAGAMGCAPIDTPCWQEPWRHEDDQQNIGVLTRDGTWLDLERGLGCDAHVVSRAALIEWSADCNGDGIVDYGQILQGQLIDANNNGIPDSCEVDPCPGDVTGNGSVNGLDLAAVLSAWGTNGQGEFSADIDDDGVVSGTDLAFVLGGWGPCP